MPEVLDDPCLVRAGRPLLLCTSRDLDVIASLRCVAALSRLFVVVALAGKGNGGKAQSKFIGSGVAGRRGPGIDHLLTVGHGTLGPEPALTGEFRELCPLLAGVSSP